MNNKNKTKATERRYKASFSLSLMSRLITLYFNTIEEIESYQKKKNYILWWIFDTTKTHKCCIWENDLMKLSHTIKK